MCEGVGFYFELFVELRGDVDPGTGFVVNVNRIDRAVRGSVVPEFSRGIQEDLGRGRGISLSRIFELLEWSSAEMSGKFGSARLGKLNLSLSPFKKAGLYIEGKKMLYFSEKFEFAAMHKLWNDDFSEQRNVEEFGKCANPRGHGHNYVIEVTVELNSTAGGAEEDGFRIGEFERVVDRDFIQLVDHKNLNSDVPDFSDRNPTVENIAAFAWDKLVGKFGNVSLHEITIWENDRTYCRYRKDSNTRQVK